MAVPDANDDIDYLRYLPAVFRQQSGDFLAQFLKPFQRLFTRSGDHCAPSLEEWLGGIEGCLGGIERYLTPGGGGEGELFRAPKEFLGWLASWTSIALQFDLEETRQRRLVARAFHLGRWRGTARGLSETLSLVFGCPVLIREQRSTFRVGKVKIREKRLETPPGDGELGETLLGEKSPYLFTIAIFPLDKAVALEKLEAQIRAVVALEKPAHATYELMTYEWKKLAFAEFKLNRARVGRDTVIR